MRHLGLHVFSSVKGGVGKSTLAVVTAKLLAEHRRVPVVVDADMLGASLADGLRLCAPEAATANGLLDLEAEATGRFYDLAETNRLRSERGRWLEDREEQLVTHQVLPPPAYINDAFTYPVPDPARECTVSALLWKHEQDEGVRYLPSSPLRVDAVRAAPYTLGLEGDFQWIRRLSWILDGLLAERPDITDIVLDLPPGVWGFAHEVMVLLGVLGRGEALPAGYPRWHEGFSWYLNPFVVTSRDRNDRLIAIEYLIYTERRVPRLVPLCNRTWQARESVRREVRADLPAVLRSLGYEDKIRFVPELPQSLGNIFISGDVVVDRRNDLLVELRLDKLAGAEEV